eukprot:6659489-Lingulodinium_polyedra.AAC.1
MDDLFLVLPDLGEDFPLRALVAAKTVIRWLGLALSQRKERLPFMVQPALGGQLTLPDHGGDHAIAELTPDKRERYASRLRHWAAGNSFDPEAAAKVAGYAQ